MGRGRSILLILFLLAGSLSPPLASQQPTAEARLTQSEQGFSLEQNYPNPVNPETWIPFHLEDTLFENSDSVVVSLRIFNVLKQVVAIPLVVDPNGVARERLIDRTYRNAGRKVAYWDGRDTAGRPVLTGVYYCQLVVGDRPQTRKLIVLNPRKGRSILPWLRNREDRSP